MNRMARLWRYPFTCMLAIAVLLGFGASPGLHTAPIAHAASAASTPGGCQLNSAKGNIQHVIYVQFDNTHFTRDNPKVPSDLEQMPHLLNFIESNGVLLSNHHTPLISHTATDILTSLTGVYGDHHGVPVSNSFRYFNPTGTSNPGVSFAYWTDPIFDPSTSTPTDTTYNMLTAAGKNAPAPWVPYTRAGCNFGAVATANTILENTAVDVAKVFGPNSPQEQEVINNPPPSTLPQADFVGIGVHCGEVLHGFIGSNDRMELTIIGEAANWTARYCAGARGGEILISPALHQRLWRRVDAELTTIETKHEGTLSAYRLKGIKSAAG